MRKLCLRNLNEAFFWPSSLCSMKHFEAVCNMKYFIRSFLMAHQHKINHSVPKKQLKTIKVCIKIKV